MKPLITLALSLLPALVSAQEYTTLVNIPGVSTGNGFDNFINTLYALSIGIAALLAVIKIVIAGVKYMLTDIVTSKESAKKDIKGALLGLTIVLAAVLILTLINPQLVNVNFDPEPVETVIPANPISPSTESATVGLGETKLPLSTAMLPTNYPVDENTLETICTTTNEELCNADLSIKAACSNGKWFPDANNSEQGRCVIPRTESGPNFFGFERGSGGGGNPTGDPTAGCDTAGVVCRKSLFCVHDSLSESCQNSTPIVTSGFYLGTAVYARQEGRRDNQTDSFPFMIDSSSNVSNFSARDGTQNTTPKNFNTWISETAGGPPISDNCEQIRSYGRIGGLGTQIEAYVQGGFHAEQGLETNSNHCKIDKNKYYFYNELMTPVPGDEPDSISIPRAWNISFKEYSESQKKTICERAGRGEECWNSNYSSGDERSEPTAACSDSRVNCTEDFPLIDDAPGGFGSIEEIYLTNNEVISSEFRIDGSNPSGQVYVDILPIGVGSPPMFKFWFSETPNGPPLTTNNRQSSGGLCEYVRNTTSQSYSVIFGDSERIGCRLESGKTYYFNQTVEDSAYTGSVGIRRSLSGAFD